MASSFPGKCRGKLLAEDEKKIQDNWCYLKENIETGIYTLIDYFYKNSLIDMKVKTRLHNCDETKKSEELLNVVMNSGPDGYNRFLECLKEAGFNGVVKQLKLECCSVDCVAEHIEKTGNEREIRIVLIGKTGVGKSSLGNTLLHLIGEDKFVSAVSAGSITDSNLLKERVTRVDKENILLKVLDTPGLSDTRKSNTEIASDLVRCINDLGPGPHVFVFVFKIDRIDDSVMTNIEYLKDIFGVCLEKYGVIVFTGKDHLEEKPFEEYLKTAKPEFKVFLSDYCKDRFAVINNKHRDKNDVEEIKKLIIKTIEDNGCDFYRNEMYEEAKTMYEEKLRVIEEEKVKVEKELQDKFIREKKEKEELIIVLDQETKEKIRIEDQLNREKREKEQLRNDFKEKLDQEIKEKVKVEKEWKDKLNCEKREKE
ncbi:GTPase IMAP family member 9 isoform X3 [Patella vulgata]|uniref:GTPase IMAP family member 9 isoform X3 n=1 Tax=Patella vulgata TaxID=6465 RepID=UPI0021803B9D|nr:GTPase IMAP family member 9 isoform X3 [Patella vulgata]